MPDRTCVRAPSSESPEQFRRRRFSREPRLAFLVLRDKTMMTLLAPSTPPADRLGGESEPASNAAEARTPEVDPAILERARAGEREALEAFIRHYQHMVFAFLGRALGRSSAVDDLSQEVFLRAYRALPRFEKRPDVRTSTWLLTIAARLVLDERRSRARAPSHRTGSWLPLRLRAATADRAPSFAPVAAKQSEKGKHHEEAARRALCPLVHLERSG